MRRQVCLIACLITGSLVFGVMMEPSAARAVEANEGAEASVDATAENESAIDDSEITARPSDELTDQVIEDLDSSTPSAFSSEGTTSAQADGSILEFSGSDRVEVANAIALAAFPGGSKTAIIAGYDGWADALGATSLAGVLDCPILLTEQAHLNQDTKSTLSQLGVTSVIVVGGPRTVSDAVLSELNAAGFTVDTRLGGADRYEVQLAIYNYAKGRWSSEYVIVASGNAFADALSASPLAYSQKAPIFLVDGSGSLNASQKTALNELAQGGGAQLKLIVGGPNSVSSATESYLSTVSSSSSNRGVHRVNGADRYEVSAEFAKWTTSQGLLSWDGAAFTTGVKPYDALTGSSLQGREGSVMLILNGGSSPTVRAFVSSNADSVKFFGGTASVPTSWRTSIISQMYQVSAYDTGVSLSRMADVEDAANAADRSTILAQLDPTNFTYGTAGYYQFADLGHFTGRVSAQQIDAFLSAACARYGHGNSTLLGLGDAIISAAQEYDINEVYLLSHAILESGWGTSALSQGTVRGYEGYYNFYGIGAYDLDPNNGGAALAKSRGWDTPEKAIRGAAQWISSNYIHSGTYGQNTLYKMRWNTAVTWHQYATDVEWASKVARVMGQAYSEMGFSFSDTGLTFLYPVYR